MQGPIRDRLPTDEDYNFTHDDSYYKSFEDIKAISDANIKEEGKVNIIDSRVPDFYD